MRYTVLGFGNDGVIIEPSLDIKYQYVSKIGNSKLNKEFDNIKLLPVFDDLYLNPNLFRYKKLTEEEIFEIKKEKEINDKLGRSRSLYDLSMPKIEGLSLLSLFDNYKNTEIMTNRWHHRYYEKNLEIITLEVFVNILNKLKHFAELLKIFNKNGYFHNDVSPMNIMLSGERLYLIDFYSLTLNSPATIPGIKTADDIDSLKNEVLMGLVDCGIYNSNIIYYLKQFKIEVAFDDKLPTIKNIENLLR